jgi:ribose transport system substrate-binding protein
VQPQIGNPGSRLANDSWNSEGNHDVVPVPRKIVRYARATVAGRIRSRRRPSFALAPLLLVCALFAGACGESAAGKGQLQIAVIPKGTTHVFWKAVERGVHDAESELGVKAIWKGPLTENDRAQQIQLVQQFTSQKVAGIALAPLDHAALAGPVAQARAAGIPVVVFDSALDGAAPKDFASTVSTDNEKAGALAGQALAERIAPDPKAEAKVVMLRYMVGSASTESREKGFLAAVKTRPTVEVLVENRYAGATAGEAKNEALNLADSLAKATGVFASNESSTMGMLLALRQLGLAGKIRFVGFDASPPLVEALRAGEIDALVVQDPRKMGSLAVKTLVAAIRGETVGASIDTGAALVTRDNLDAPDIRRLLE